jgi:hypothetical protein
MSGVASTTKAVPVVKLVLQPDDGLEPILKALDREKKSIQILIYRIDRSEVERALTAAVERGGFRAGAGSRHQPRRREDSSPL